MHIILLYRLIANEMETHFPCFLQHLASCSTVEYQDKGGGHALTPRRP